MAWWKDISSRARGWIAFTGVVFGFLGSAFALGAKTSATVAGLRDVPARMDVAEKRLDNLDTAVMRLEAYADLVDDNRALIAAVADTTSLTWCVVREQALGHDPQRACLYRESGK